MSLSLALNNAVTGLGVSQSGISTISHNVSNANTDGYSKQQIVQRSLTFSNVGSGALLDAISRRSDQFVTDSIRDQKSYTAYTGTINSYQERIQIQFGTPGTDNTLTNQIDSMFAALDNLANNPESTSIRQASLREVNNTVEAINRTAQSLEDLRFEADQDISRAVTNVNQALKLLQFANEDIARSAQYGEVSGDLLDERDRILNEIATYVDIDPVIGENNIAYVYTSSGLSLLDTSLYELSYSGVNGPEALIADSALGAIYVAPVGRDGEPQVALQRELVAASERGSVDAVIETGSLKALVDIRDVVIPEQLDALDEFAYNMISEFNALHNDGSGFPPLASYQGQRLSSASEVRNWEGTFAIALTDANGQPIASPYPDEPAGLRTQFLDFSFDSGEGEVGQHSTQTILDEINAYYGTPAKKVQINHLNDIRLVAMEENDVFTGNMQFDFDLSNISSDQADIDILNIDINALAFAPPAALPSGTYSVNAGEQGRTGSAFSFNATGLLAGVNTIDIDVQVTNPADGTVVTETLTFTVDMTNTDIRNDRFVADLPVLPAIATGVEVFPTSSQPLLNASLVDIDGNAIAAGQAGYLKITAATNTDNRVVLQDLTSSDSGQLFETPPVRGTEKGFMDFFGMNNFFDQFQDGTDSNENLRSDAALNMTIRSDILNDPNRFSNGTLNRTLQATDPDTPPTYTYELGRGGNDVLRQIADLGQQNFTFSSNALLAESSNSLSGYMSDIVATISTDAAFALESFEQAEFNGGIFEQQLDSISGVNIDEELASLLIYQNTYTASSQIISVTDELFQALLQATQ